jgi:ubiquinone/menaquinone biosynthesis C-methylase UbiE
MLEIDKFLAASAKNLEGLSWYEIASRLGLLSFNTQGNKPIELTAKLAQITHSSMVLIVGCGAGGTAVHLAETTGAEVYGIDISPESIRTANILASKSPAHQKLHFQIGDAHALSFPPNTFDVIITEFMAFLLKQSAFKRFFSTLKPSGHIALIELMKDPKVNPRADKRILAAEKTYSTVLGYRFHIPLIIEYVEWLTKAGFEHVHLAERFTEPSLRERIRNVGGWKNLFKITKVTLKLMLASPSLRKKFIHVGLVKRVLYQNRPTAKYIFQAILIGRKTDN